MKAAYTEDFCDVSGIRYGELPDPGPGAGGGAGAVGTVTAAGAGVDDLRASERVWTNSAGYDGRREQSPNWPWPLRAGELEDRRHVVRWDRLYPLPPGADPMAGRWRG